MAGLLFFTFPAIVDAASCALARSNCFKKTAKLPRLAIFLPYCSECRIFQGEAGNDISLRSRQSVASRRALVGLFSVPALLFSATLPFSSAATQRSS